MRALITSIDAKLHADSRGIYSEILRARFSPGAQYAALECICIRWRSATAALAARLGSAAVRSRAKRGSSDGLSRSGKDLQKLAISN